MKLRSSMILLALAVGKGDSVFRRGVRRRRVDVLARPAAPCFDNTRAGPLAREGAHETVFIEPAKHHLGLSEPAAPARSACQRPAHTPTAESGVSPTNCTGRRRNA